MSTFAMSTGQAALAASSFILSAWGVKNQLPKVLKGGTSFANLGGRACSAAMDALTALSFRQAVRSTLDYCMTSDVGYVVPPTFLRKFLNKLIFNNLPKLTQNFDIATTSAYALTAFGLLNIVPNVLLGNNSLNPGKPYDSTRSRLALSLLIYATTIAIDHLLSPHYTLENAATASSYFVSFIGCSLSAMSSSAYMVGSLLTTAYSGIQFIYNLF